MGLCWEPLIGLILAGLSVTAALKGDDGNSVFEMRSHSIQGVSARRQTHTTARQSAASQPFPCSPSIPLPPPDSFSPSSRISVTVDPDRERFDGDCAGMRARRRSLVGELAEGLS